MNYSFQIGDKAVYIPTNETVKIVSIDLSHRHIEVAFDDGAETVIELQSIRTLEGETKVMQTFKDGDKVYIKTNDKWNGKNGVVLGSVRDLDQTFYEVAFSEGKTSTFSDYELILFNNYVVNKVGYFEEKGHKLGKLVDEKQAAYGDSISKASKLMKVYLEDYKTSDGYLIPEELLDHVLLQVRIIDKQNRIFSNPKADKMDESPYDDISGYGLLGGRVQNG